MAAASASNKAREALETSFRALSSAFKSLTTRNETPDLETTPTEDPRFRALQNAFETAPKSVLDAWAGVDISDAKGKGKGTAAGAGSQGKSKSKDQADDNLLDEAPPAENVEKEEEDDFEPERDVDDVVAAEGGDSLACRFMELLKRAAQLPQPRRTHTAQPFSVRTARPPPQRTIECEEKHLAAMASQRATYNKYNSFFHEDLHLQHLRNLEALGITHHGLVNDPVLTIPKFKIAGERAGLTSKTPHVAYLVAIWIKSTRLHQFSSRVMQRLEGAGTAGQIWLGPARTILKRCAELARTRDRVPVAYVGKTDDLGGWDARFNNGHGYDSQFFGFFVRTALDYEWEGDVVVEGAPFMSLDGLSADARGVCEIGTAALFGWDNVANRSFKSEAFEPVVDTALKMDLPLGTENPFLKKKDIGLVIVLDAAPDTANTEMPATHTLDMHLGQVFEAPIKFILLDAQWQNRSNDNYDPVKEYTNVYRPVVEQAKYVVASWAAHETFKKLDWFKPTDGRSLKQLNTGDSAQVVFPDGHTARYYRTYHPTVANHAPALAPYYFDTNTATYVEIREDALGAAVGETNPRIALAQQARDRGLATVRERRRQGRARLAALMVAKHKQLHGDRYEEVQKCIQQLAQANEGRSVWKVEERARLATTKNNGRKYLLEWASSRAGGGEGEDNNISLWVVSSTFVGPSGSGSHLDKPVDGSPVFVEVYADKNYILVEHNGELCAAMPLSVAKLKKSAIPYVQVALMERSTTPECLEERFGFWRDPPALSSRMRMRYDRDPQALERDWLALVAMKPKPKKMKKKKTAKKTVKKGEEEDSEGESDAGDEEEDWGDLTVCLPPEYSGKYSRPGLQDVPWRIQDHSPTINTYVGSKARFQVVLTKGRRLRDGGPQSLDVVLKDKEDPNKSSTQIAVEVRREPPPGVLPEKPLTGVTRIIKAKKPPPGAGIYVTIDGLYRYHIPTLEALGMRDTWSFVANRILLGDLDFPKSLVEHRLRGG